MQPSLAAFDSAYHSEGKSGWDKLLHRPWSILQTEFLRRLSVRADDPPRLREATLFWGQTMSVQLPDAVGIHLLRYGYFERDMTRFFLKHLHPGDSFYDVGAHFGFFSVLAAALVGPEGRLVAVEPTPRTAAVLTRNLAAFPGGQVLQCAASDSAGELTFIDHGIARSAFNSLHADPSEGAGTPLTVKALPLDEMVARTGVRPNLIKIDAERAEAGILRGATKTLADHSPMITLEMGDQGEGDHHSRALIEQMAVLGYRPFEISGDGSLAPHVPQAFYGYTNLVFRR